MLCVKTSTHMFILDVFFRSIYIIRDIIKIDKIETIVNNIGNSRLLYPMMSQKIKQTSQGTFTSIVAVRAFLSLREFVLSTFSFPIHKLTEFYFLPKCLAVTDLLLSLLGSQSSSHSTSSSAQQ